MPASFLGRAPRSAAARTRGAPPRRSVVRTAPARHGRESRLPQTWRGAAPRPPPPSPPGEPLAQRVSRAPRRGAEPAARGGREGGSEPRRSAVEPGPSTDLAFPPRLAQQRDPKAARPRGRRSPPPRVARCSPFPRARVFFSLFDFFPAQSAAHGRPSSNPANLPRGSKIPRGRPLPAHVSSPAKSRERIVTISPPPHYRVRERERRRALQATALQTPLSSASPLHGRRRRAHLPLDCGL